MRKHLIETRKVVTQQATKQITQQATESDIQRLLTVLHKLGCPRKTAIGQLIEQYQLAHAIAIAKADDLKERSL